VLDREIGRSVANVDTRLYNCAAGTISGDDDAIVPLPGASADNFAGDLFAELRDPRNLDFRPRKGSRLVDAGSVVPPIDVSEYGLGMFGGTASFVGEAPDIGAYEYGAREYWIPGYQSLQASTPAPPAGAVQAKRDADLMWLGGYKAAEHVLYFGDDKHAVASANRKSPLCKGIQQSNIFTPGALEAGKRYYWRVDATGPKGVIKGEVWDFTTEGRERMQTFDVVADAHVVKPGPDKNFGDAPLMELLNYEEYLFPKSNTQLGYLKFRVAGLKGRVVGAKLRLVPANNANDIHVRSVLENVWEENGTTWNNRPVCNFYPLDAIGPVVKDAPCEFDVRDFVKGEGVYSFGVCSSDSARVYSKEAEGGKHKAQLTVLVLED